MTELTLKAQDETIDELIKLIKQIKSNTMIVSYYTDGSYSPQQKIGVAGFMVNDDIFLVDTEQKNTQCEYLAAKMALEHAIDKEYQHIKIFTDCAGIIDTIDKVRRDRWPDLFELLDKFNGDVDWVKVKGHFKQSDKDDDDIQFQKIDKAVRKKLRNSKILHHWLIAYNSGACETNPLDNVYVVKALTEYDALIHYFRKYPDLYVLKDELCMHNELPEYLTEEETRLFTDSENEMSAEHIKDFFLSSTDKRLENLFSKYCPVQIRRWSKLERLE